MSGGMFYSGPVQLQMDVKLHKDSDDWEFLTDWYGLFPWLEYSQKLNAD